ncbi:MAG: type II secretion system F family protein [Nocardioidaceae bacterium]|nr:type II secretion system F family protein [Nocardioidaceae bacterium]
MSWMFIVLCGMVAGLGVALIVRELTPAHTDLSAAIDNLAPKNFTNATTRRVAPTLTDPAAGADRIGAWLEKTLAGRSWAKAPEEDLDLLGMSTQRFWTQKATMSLAGFLAFSTMGVILSVLGVPLPFVLPFGFSLMVAAVLWFAPDLVVRDEAKERREEFAFATVSYLRLVAIRRLGREGVVSAMAGASKISDEWMFNRIRETLQRAQWSNVAPWDALDELATDLRVLELHEIADITRLSSSGGSITDSLMSRAASMRDRILSLERRRAAEATTALTAPLVVMIFLFMAAILFPAGMSLLG